MMRHIVLFRLKQDKKHLALETVSVLKKLIAIPEVENIEIGVNELNTDRSYDIAMTIDFENIENYHIYDTHILHEPVRKYIHITVESSVTVDYMRA